MKCLWDRLHVWLLSHAPPLLASLRPGATEEAIRAAERALGFRLPDDVKSCYRIHDGQELAVGTAFPLDFFAGLGWNSLQAMLDARHSQAELARRGDFVMHESTTNEYLVQARYYPERVPLLQGAFQGGIVYLGLDLAAEPGGRVIVYFSESDYRSEMAPNLRQALTQFLESLEAGNWQYVTGRGLTPVPAG